MSHKRVLGNFSEVVGIFQRTWRHQTSEHGYLVWTGPWRVIEPQQPARVVCMIEVRAWVNPTLRKTQYDQIRLGYFRNKSKIQWPKFETGTRHRLLATSVHTHVVAWLSRRCISKHRRESKISLLNLWKLLQIFQSSWSVVHHSKASLLTPSFRFFTTFAHTIVHPIFQRIHHSETLW